eukprot:jgi/Mesen1/3348/ME000191S02488
MASNNPSPSPKQLSGEQLARLFLDVEGLDHKHALRTLGTLQNGLSFESMGVKMRADVAGGSYNLPQFVDDINQLCGTLHAQGPEQAHLAQGLLEGVKRLIVTAVSAQDHQHQHQHQHQGELIEPAQRYQQQQLGPPPPGSVWAAAQVPPHLGGGPYGPGHGQAAYPMNAFLPPGSIYGPNGNAYQMPAPPQPLPPPGMHAEMAYLPPNHAMPHHHIQSSSPAADVPPLLGPGGHAQLMSQLSADTLPGPFPPSMTPGVNPLPMPSPGATAANPNPQPVLRHLAYARARGRPSGSPRIAGAPSSRQMLKRDGRVLEFRPGGSARCAAASCDGGDGLEASPGALSESGFIAGKAPRRGKKKDKPRRKPDAAAARSADGAADTPPPDGAVSSVLFPPHALTPVPLPAGFGQPDKATAAPLSSSPASALPTPPADIGGVDPASSAAALASSALVVAPLPAEVCTAIGRLLRALSSRFSIFEAAGGGACPEVIDAAALLEPDLTPLADALAAARYASLDALLADYRRVCDTIGIFRVHETSRHAPLLRPYTQT